MTLSLLLVWAFVAWHFDPRFWQLASETPGGFAKAVIVVFAVCLNFFWLIAMYHGGLMMFTAISNGRARPSRQWTGAPPKVAILYTTMHDFQERAALSCVLQDYDNFRVYLLDDSVDADAQRTVDEFARLHPERVTVVRRPVRKGFKAGSLNYALRSVAVDVEFFAVADADSVLPPDFIRRLLPYFAGDERVAWVQASHRPHPEQHSEFARDLCLGIVPLWTVYYGPKNDFGFVPFLGHGGLIRRHAWQEIGGFPELVSEDLCLSTRLARRGYRGMFADDVICYEDFPEGYRQLRRQQEKYIKGACEFFHRECPAFLSSPVVPWHEKVDVVLSCLTLFAPIVHLVFLFTYCHLIPALMGRWELLTLGFFGREVSFSVLTPGTQLLGLWTADFYCLTIACTLAPVLGAIGVAWKEPLRGTKMLLLSAVPYLSLMIVATGACLAYLVSRRAVFLVTGDKWGADRHRWPRDFRPDAALPERIGSEDHGTQLAEVMAGLLLVGMCLMTANVTLLGLALAMGLGPVLLRTRWEEKWLRPLLCLPFLMVWSGLLLATPVTLAGQGVYLSVFVFHF